MLTIDLSGKRAFVAGVADDGGFGFAIAKALAEAGASICRRHLAARARHLQDHARARQVRRVAAAHRRQQARSSSASIRSTPTTTSLADVPAEVRESKRYREHGDVTIDGVAAAPARRLRRAVPRHRRARLANGPEVKKPLLETSAQGLPRRRRRLAPIRTRRWCSGSARWCARAARSWRSPTWRRERVVPGYGGGMSSAKAALESDTRVLAYEAGRKWGHRVNVISAGPCASRAARAIGFIETMIEYCKANSPLPEAIAAREVGATAAFLLEPARQRHHRHHGLRRQGLSLDGRRGRSPVADVSCVTSFAPPPCATQRIASAIYRKLVEYRIARLLVHAVHIRRPVTRRFDDAVAGRCSRPGSR